ncbi:MAG: T9SS type A sorting domain-containing protein [Mariniphaga sp.]|nr:T9SS type A sorting domain-containing protein [Mariniphaga sp.]
MEIYNEAQMLILKKTGIKTQSAILNTKNMAEGIYIVRAIVGGNIVSAKLVVAK